MPDAPPAITKLLQEWSSGDPAALVVEGGQELACYIPARRAAKVEALVALRLE
jgi:hypothetical protein